LSGGGAVPIETALLASCDGLGEGSERADSDRAAHIKAPILALILRILALFQLRHVHPLSLVHMAGILA
jgi:hypothetical protein